MTFSTRTHRAFDKQLKRLVKKYPSLLEEYARLITGLSEQPTQGTPIGNDCYKIRLAIKSKRQRKSGGARVVTHVQVTTTRVYLLSIYDKSEQPDISDAELQSLIASIPEE